MAQSNQTKKEDRIAIKQGLLGLLVFLSGCVSGAGNKVKSNHRWRADDHDENLQDFWNVEENVARKLGRKRGRHYQRPRSNWYNNGKGSYLYAKNKRKPVREVPVPIPDPVPDPAPYVLPDDDLGIRYSKIFFPEGTRRTSDELLVLTWEDFAPLHLEVANLLRQTQCISVVMQEDCMECDIPTEELLDMVGGHPLHPSSNQMSPYWDELREVVRVQNQRRAGVSATDVMPLADIWANKSLDEIAECVHDEIPGYNQLKLIMQLLREGVTVDRDVIPSLSATEFLRKEVMLSDMNTWAIGKVGPYNFACKWFVGRARPEEVAWLITEKRLTAADGVPQDLVDEILSLNLTSQFDFTAYPEGSPTHPSWPAMHSASAATSLWLAVVLDLNSTQYCQCQLTDYNIAYARTVAGVHFASDNIAGLNLAQELLALKLPDYFVEKYGSNKALVEEKIASLRFDWNDFLSSGCADSGY